jgi:putative hydrolase of HD superfamily
MGGENNSKGLGMLPKTERPSDQQPPEPAEWLDLLLAAGVMKNLPRSGWRQAGITDCESVADHSFRVIVIALLLGELVEGIDRDKLLRMAVLHELPESKLTDLPLSAVRLLGRDAKYRAEDQAWDDLLPAGGRLDEWQALWREFEVGRTPEARLTRAADRLELLLQAYEYERSGRRNLDEFWETDALEQSEFEPVRTLTGELLRRRELLKSR